MLLRAVLASRHDLDVHASFISNELVYDVYEIAWHQLLLLRAVLAIHQDYRTIGFSK